MNYFNYLIISFVGGIITTLLIYIIIKIYHRYATKDYISLDKDWIIVSV
jgi:predicted phosphoadenosine phosphosulfate sulfurtransferase